VSWAAESLTWPHAAYQNKLLAKRTSIAEQMQADRVDWAQLIRQAQQQGIPAPTAKAGRGPPVTTVACCFAGSQPWLLDLAKRAIGALGEGSSISAGLTAAGYDMGAVLQGFMGLAACYPGAAWC
jgi:hypothetical protein